MASLDTALFEQTEFWLTPDGRTVRIEDMPHDMLLFVIDYMLTHAKRMRDAWSAEQRRTYDQTEKPRRWMLRRPAICAMLKEYAAGAERRRVWNIEAAFEEAHHPSP